MIPTLPRSAPSRRCSSRSVIAVALLLGALLLGVLACRPAERAAPAGADSRTIRIGTFANFETPNDLIAGGSQFNFTIVRQLFASLAREVPEYSAEQPVPMRPELARSWTASEDGLQLTFTLRDDALWSDGTPVTAADVVFTWQAQTSPEVSWINAPVKQNIAEVRAVEGDDLGRFDWVIATAPATQTAALLPTLPLPPSATMLGCYALMLGFADTAIPSLDWQAALVREADISWASVNSSKPGRGPAFSIVVHSTNRYADANMGSDLKAVEAHLLQELRAVTGIDVNAADHCALHRWRYANIARQAGPAAVLDPEQKLGACGDWLVSGRIESAFTSALDLAGLLQTHL